jgi:hypothetical protein
LELFDRTPGNRERRKPTTYIAAIGVCKRDR